MSAKKTDSDSSAPQKLELVPGKLPRKPNGFVLFAFRCGDNAILSDTRTLFHSYADTDVASVPEFPFLGNNGRQVVHSKGRDERIAASYYSEPEEPDVCYLIIKKVNAVGKSLNSDIYPGTIEQAQKECLRLLLEKKQITSATSEKAITHNRKKIKELWQAHDNVKIAEGAKQPAPETQWVAGVRPADENQAPASDTALLLPSNIIRLRQPGDDIQER